MLFFFKNSFVSKNPNTTLFSSLQNQSMPVIKLSRVNVFVEKGVELLSKFNLVDFVKMLITGNLDN